MEKLKLNPKLFKSLKNAITVIIILYMINNLEHSTHVYYGISKKQLSEIFGWEYADWFQSLLVIIVIDLSVMAWIKMNRYWEAGVFGFLIISLNLLYYEWPGIFTETINKRIAEFLFSGMFGFGLISFSYLSAKINEAELEENSLRPENQSKMNEFESKIKGLEAELNQSKALNKEIESNLNQILCVKQIIESERNKLESLLAIANQTLNERDDLQRELNLWKQKDEQGRTCEYCNDVLESTDSKRVHKGQCSKNPKNLEKRNIEISLEKGE